MKILKKFRKHGLEEGSLSLLKTYLGLSTTVILKRSDRRPVSIEKGFCSICILEHVKMTGETYFPEMHRLLKAEWDFSYKDEG